jgi:hypothetical protein
MSVDICRLENVLEDIRILNDGMMECRDITRDVVAAVFPVELETDPEGHVALRNIAAEIRLANIHTLFIEREIHDILMDLCTKARA